MSQQRIIWGAIAFSTVIYLVILLTLHPHAPATSLDVATLPLVVKICLAMALFEFLLGWILPGRLIVKEPRQRMIIAMAIFESCAIFGLVAAFFTQDWRLYIGPWVLAIIGFLRNFPRDESATRPGSM